MSLREIVLWPDPRLSQVCEPVSDPASVADLVADMFETMYAAPGRGLAAPQVGEMKRLFVMDAGWKSGEKTPLACINPRIVEAADTHVTGDEGCLSIPGILVPVARAETVTMRFSDLRGQEHERAFTGQEAIIAQHEYDHLDGLVHFDRLPAEERRAKILEYGARG